MRLAIVVPILLLALAGCETAPAPEAALESAVPVPTVMRVSLTGKAQGVLGEGIGGQVALLREGADEPVAVDFRNGEIAKAALAPGTYEVAKIGTLECRGLGFEVSPGETGRALGRLEAEVIATDYYVGLPKRPRAAPEDAATLAAQLGASAGAIDDTPIAATTDAICFVGRNYETAKWSDLPVSDRVVLGILMAGFCAAALAAGGICAF